MQSRILIDALFVVHSFQQLYEDMKFLLSRLLIYTTGVTHVLHIYDPQNFLFLGVSPFFYYKHHLK